jgi:filamentous hemagglutinin family protein
VVGISARIAERRRGVHFLLISALLGSTSAFAAGALPSGGQFIAGQGTIVSSAHGTVVGQSSTLGIVNWNTFSVGSGNSVIFNNGNGATLNRVTGGQLSQIDGSLKATGSVYLINPQGIVIGPSGQVIANGSFLASTRDVDNNAFMSGQPFSASGTSNGSIINEGVITSRTGDAILVGSTVTNTGTISAPNGTVSLAAGNEITLQPAGSDPRIAISGGTGSVTNSGNISAAQAELASAGGNVYALVENNGGTISATGTQTINGHVWLTAGGTTTITGTILAANANGSGGAVTVRGSNIQLSGTVNASATTAGQTGGAISIVAANSDTVTGTIKAAGGVGGLGGTIETSGHLLSIDGSTVNAGKGGNWLLDPYDLTVNSSAASSIDNSLNADTSVTLKTTASGTSGPGTANASGNGDIFVDSALGWNTSATLTLDAYRSIDILAPITIAGTGGVVLKTNDGGTNGSLSFGLSPAGFAGDIQFTGTPHSGQSLTFNGTSYTLLYSMSDVQAINNTLGGNYALANSLNASSTGSWIPIGTDGAGTIYNYPSGFSGVFDGLGNTIANLNINIPSTYFVGLFGYSTGTVRNIGLTGGSVSGVSNVGALVGKSSSGTISNSYATDTISGGNAIGGLVGSNSGGTITGSFATGAVAATGSEAGGLTGDNSSGAISNSFATGAVSASGSYVGGLVGDGGGTSSIANSYATGAVSAGTTLYGSGDYVGGLAGVAGGTTTNSYATGAVKGTSYVGGLLGQGGGTITNDYATGTVCCFQNTGGLVGYLYNGSISNSYATGAVSGGDSGGLVGATYDSSISNSYATGAVNGAGDVGGLVGALGMVNQSSGDSISNSYATGAVTANAAAGGLVGDNGGAITGSFASGSTTITGGSGYFGVGGLVGINEAATSNHGAGSISNSYATGAVYALSGATNIGGLVGFNDSTISDSYATGAVTASSGPFISVGGFVGQNQGTITAGTWATDTSGKTVGLGGDTTNQSGNVTGRTIAQLQGALPSGFSNATWGTGSGLLPYLLWQAPSGTPQAVSGFIYNPSGSADAGQASSVVVNGANNTLATFESGVNGYFYDLVAPGTISNSGSEVLVYFQSPGGAALQSATGNLSGLTVYSGYLTLATAGTSYASAIGNLSSNLATAIGGNSAVQAAVNSFGIGVFASGSSFTVDTPVTLSQNLLIETSAANANIAINDPVTLTGGAGLTLISSGAISQNSSGTINAATLTGTSSGAVTLTAQNDIANLGAFSTNNAALSLTNAEALNIDGAVNVGTGTLTLNVTGAISTNSSGIITAGTLTGQSTGATSLTANNAITNLASFTTSNSAFSLTNSGALTLTGALNAGAGNVAFVVGGALTESGAGAITANSLSGSSNGNATLNLTDNTISLLGNFTTNNGNLGLVDLAPLTVIGTVNSGTGNVVVATNGAGSGIVVNGTLSGNVVGVVSSGSLTLNSALTFPYTTTGVELSAAGALYINAPISLQSAGAVILDTGFDTTTVPGKSIPELEFGAFGHVSFGSLDQGSELEINGTQYQLLYSLSDIQQYTTTSAYLSGDYALASSIDASSTTGWVPVGTNGSGTVLNSGAGFSGTFEGLGNSISNLTVSTGSANYAGLFGYSSGTIRDLTLTGGSVTGGKYVGALVGYQSGVVSNVIVTVPVTGNSDVGGIAGDNAGAITQSFATGPVAGSGTSSAGGGAVGLNSGTLVDDYATGAVTVSSQGGGLVGSNSGTLTDDYSTGAVSGGNGGLVGVVNGGSITNSYWDTQTSGDTSSAGGTGLTTAQLQSALPSGFSAVVWGAGSGLFPYLLKEFSNGAPDIVSGTAYTGVGGSPAAGETLTVLEDGTPIASVTTDANGNYSALLAPGGDAVIYGKGTAGASLVENISGPVTGLPIYGNTLSEITGDSSYSVVNTAFSIATGGTNQIDITAGNTIGNLATLRIDSTAPSFTVDEAINATTLDLIAAGSINQNGGAITATTFMGSSNGPATLSYVFITNFGGFTTNNGALSLQLSGIDSTSTAINVTGPINTGTGSLSLTTFGYSNVLNIDAPLTASTIALSSAGSVTQSSAGIITTSALTGSAGGSVPLETVALTANNAVANLGAFEAEGGFTLNNATALSVTGAIDARSGNLSLTTTGAGSNLAIDASLTGTAISLVSSATLYINTNIVIPGAGKLSLTTGPNDSYVIASGDSITFTGGPSSGASLSIDGAPYTLIYSMSELQNINSSATTLSANYALANSLNAATDPSTPASWVPIGTDGAGTRENSGSGFSGIFNGFGYTISNLTVNLPSTSYVGLFGYTTGTIQNVNIAGGSIAGSNEVGGLAAYNSGTITSVSANGVAVTGNGSNVGGLVGYNAGSIARTFSSDAVDNTSGGFGTGGLVGYQTSLGSIGSSIATGSVTGGSYIGGLVGFNQGLVHGASSASGAVNGVVIVGGLVGYSDGTINTVSAGTGTVSGDYYVGGLVGENDTGGTVSASTTSSASVSGTALIGGLVGQNFGTVNGNSSSTDTPSGALEIGGLIGYNAGSIANSSAGGTTVSSDAGSYVGGLVGANAGSIAQSSSSDAVDNTGSGFATGGLVGYNVASGTIGSSTASGSVTNGSYIGGLVGFNDGTVNGASSASGSVSGVAAVGGLVGYNDGTIDNVSAGTGTVSGTYYVGGLVGYNFGAITQSSSSDTVSVGADAFGTGGLVGDNQSSGTISNSTASGSVTGGSYMGGLVGVNDGTVNGSSSAHGAVSGDDVVGGLVGDNVGTINTVSAGTGTVAGTYYVGGLVGENDPTGTISAGTTSGASVSGSIMIGGLVGQNLGTVNGNSSSTETVSGLADIGGLAGYSSGAIASSTTSGATISSTGGSYVGGLVGYNAGSIAHTSSSDIVDNGVQGFGTGGLVGYNQSSGTIGSSTETGAVTGGSYMGGLVGANYGTVNGSSSASGAVSGGNVVGGLVGENNGTISTASAGTGAVSGAYYVGGLVGENDAAGTISAATTSGTSVSGTTIVGGLVGDNFGAINSSSSTDAVSGLNEIGGLAGYNSGSIATSASSGATVTSTSGAYVGGLVGQNAGSIAQSLSSDTVNAGAGSLGAGGLVGYNTAAATVTDTYADGAVAGGNAVGGLIGYMAGSLSTSWSSGAVSGSTSVGGAVGDNASGGVLTDVYWDEGTSGQTNALGAGSLASSTNVTGIGGTTGNNPDSQATYVGFNFSTIWTIDPGTSRPFLKGVSPQSPPS